MGLLQKLLFSDQTPVLVKKSLDMQTNRQSVIASNIANADTPGYKAKDITFEEQLRSVSSGKQIELAGTNSKHFSASGIDSIKSVRPDLVVDPSQGGLDGNNVNMETEVAKMTEVQLKYSAATQMLMKHGSIAASAIRDVR